MPLPPSVLVARRSASCWSFATCLVWTLTACPGEIESNMESEPPGLSDPAGDPALGDGADPGAGAHDGGPGDGMGPGLADGPDAGEMADAGATDGPGATDGGPGVDPADIDPDTRVEAVFMAQTHVQSPEDPLFKLVGERAALLKAQVVAPNGGVAPAVTAVLRIGDESAELPMQGPAELPGTFEPTPGVVQHLHEDSFTAVVPADWVRPGLSVEVRAHNSAVVHAVRVGAPSRIRMRMFDVHYFGEGSGDYPLGWRSELESKWPVAALDVERVRGTEFLELVIPARAGAGAARIRSRQEYLDKTGLNFDGEQAAALQWVHALSASGGNQDTAMCYVNILGVPAGGQAGGFDGVGGISAGIFNHELGHALSLPHWGNNANYPYKGDMHGIAAPDVLNGTHVGPTWAFDLPSLTFIPPTVQRASGPWVAGTYKASPMQGGGVGDQEQRFIFRHFSDFGVNQMQGYVEGKLAVERAGQWFRWDDAAGAYAAPVDSDGVRYPIETELEVISVMAATSLADRDVNMAYVPIGPYTGNLIRRFDPGVAADREAAAASYCPAGGCDFSLRVVQGGQTRQYMLASSANVGDDPLAGGSLTTVAVNLRASDGPVTDVALLLTPDAQVQGAAPDAEVLHRWTGEVGSDQCPADAGKLQPGQCGCGVSDADADGDDVADCLDECPLDARKAVPGECGCGFFEGTCTPMGRYEAEDASAFEDVSAVAQADMVTGWGYADFGGEGSSLLWEGVSAQSPGSYALRFRYANGGGGRPATIVVNGVDAAEVAFGNTGGWGQWETVAAEVALVAGPNSVMVRAASGAGGPNIDHVEVGSVD